jgi:hypothetical protein
MDSLELFLSLCPAKITESVRFPSCLSLITMRLRSCTTSAKKGEQRDRPAARMTRSFRVDGRMGFRPSSNPSSTVSHHLLCSLPFRPIVATIVFFSELLLRLLAFLGAFLVAQDTSPCFFYRNHRVH